MQFEAIINVYALNKVKIRLEEIKYEEDRTHYNTFKFKN